MIYGYARVSTQKQSLQRQLDNIKEYNPSAIIYQEKFTGTEIDGRKEFKKLLKQVKTDDTIIFDSVSRMSRNAEEGFELYKKLFNNGVHLEFIKEPHINTSIYAKAIGNKVELNSDNELLQVTEDFINRVLNIIAKEQIIIAFEQAEKEVKDLQKRVTEGLKKAKDNGKILGRRTGTKVNTKKSIDVKKKIIECSKSFNGNLSDTDCIKLTGINRNTFYKYKKEIKEEYELL